jgi:hypothetical protein
MATKAVGHDVCSPHYVRPPNVAVLTRESPSAARVSSAFNTQLGSLVAFSG